MTKSIHTLLRERHYGQAYFEEVLMGPSGSRRLDAWVVLPTWSPMTTVGYEVKVTRSDFLRDHKWSEYLPICNRFSFVCPRGIIEPGELPGGVGLIWTTKSGGRLLTKRKAARREVDPSKVVKALTSVLITKVFPMNVHESLDRATRVAGWRKWIQESEESKEVGRYLAHQMGAEYRKVRAENAELRKREEWADGVIKAAESIGLKYPWGDQPSHVTDLRARASGVSGPMLNQLDSTIRTLGTMLRGVEYARERLREIHERSLGSSNGGGA